LASQGPFPLASRGYRLHQPGIDTQAHCHNCGTMIAGCFGFQSLHALEEVDPLGLGMGNEEHGVSANIGVGSPNHADVISTLNIPVPSAFHGEAVELEGEP
jgi:hypothetical protein